MARRASKLNERIEALEKKIENKKSQIKALEKQRDAFKAEQQKQDMSELYDLMKAKKLDAKTVIDLIEDVVP